MNKFKQAHQMAKTIKRIYKDVDYKFQFSLCLKFLSGKEIPKGEPEHKAPPKVKTQNPAADEIINEFNKIRVDGVKFKFNLWVKTLTKRIYIKATLKGTEYNLGYVDIKIKCIFTPNAKNLPEPIIGAVKQFEEVLKIMRG